MSTVKLSGCERVLRILRLGPTHQGEWFTPGDGGKPITRLGARIWDLQEQGYEIEPGRVEGCAFAVYTLVSEPPAPSPAEPAPVHRIPTFEVSNGDPTFKDPYAQLRMTV